MAAVKEVVTYLNTTDKYLITKGREENFTYFTWTSATITASSQNILASAQSNKIVSMTVTGKDTTVERQNHINAQNVAQKSVIITTVETYNPAGSTKSLNKKRSFSFPRQANNIWITYVLNKSLDKSKIKNFKGVPTYKQGRGGRFVIGAISDTIMTKTITDYLAQVEAARTTRNESTTTTEEVELT